MMSTAVGSIADNTGGGIYGYRASKAALNMIVKNLSVELKDILVVAIHPGWVQTEMGGPKALISTKESVEGIITTLAGLKPENTGMFKRYNNTDIPW